MAITEAFQSSQAVDTDEWDLPSDTTNLSTQTDDGVYQCYLDLNSLVAGDVFEFRCYEKVGSALTQRVVYSARFAGAQSCPTWVSPTLILMHGWTMSLKEIAGAARTIDWSIRKVA